jgi:hypothetical protein
MLVNLGRGQPWSKAAASTTLLRLRQQSRPVAASMASFRSREGGAEKLEKDADLRQRRSVARVHGVDDARQRLIEDARAAPDFMSTILAPPQQHERQEMLTAIDRVISLAEPDRLPSA